MAFTGVAEGHRIMRLRAVLAAFCVLALAGLAPWWGAAAQQAEIWPKLDVRGLARAAGIPTVEVTIAEDPVYGGEKRYRGIPLVAVLEAIPAVEDLARRGALVVFHAADGYTAAMDLERALSGGGVLAVSDLDVPPGHTWTAIEQGGREVSPAPLYLVWPDADSGDPRYVWPYQIETVEVKSFAEQYGASVPAARDGVPDEAVRRGFEQMRVRCLTCHAVNLVGGDLGPELNVPMNVTEYWKPEMLPRYIRDAPSFHARSKMPSFRNALSDRDVDDILAYLHFMAAQKVCGAETPCE
jgi:mono/diheme cytochrome c family protein